MPPPPSTTFEMDTAGPVYGCLVHVSILDLQNPKVTRLLTINSDKTFSDLHVGIQAALHWENKSSYGFSRVLLDETPQSTNGPSSANEQGAVSIPKESRLSTIFDEMDPDKRVVAYKYGANWVLTVKLITRMAITGRLYCMSGRGHPPAESLTPAQWTKDVQAYEKATTKKDKESARKPFDKGVKFADGNAGGIAGPWNWNEGGATANMDKTSSSIVKDESSASAHVVPYPKAKTISYPQNPKGNYIIVVLLQFTQCPSITRFLSCPPGLSFEDLDKAIQIAFGWTTSHMSQFEIRESETNFGPSLIQIARDPMDTSMEGEENKTSLEKSTNITLEAVFEDPKYKGRSITYEYDFGDSWEHDISVLGRADVATKQVVCIEGEGHRCAEDCGKETHILQTHYFIGANTDGIAISGWEDLKEDYMFNNGDKELRRWYEKDCFNGDRFGLGGDRAWRWNQEEINASLSSLRSS